MDITANWLSQHFALYCGQYLLPFQCGPGSWLFCILVMLPSLHLLQAQKLDMDSNTLMKLYAE